MNHETDTPRTDDHIRDAAKMVPDHIGDANKMVSDHYEGLLEMVPLKLSIRPYSYICADGCCSEYGETWSVDGKEIASGPCEYNRMKQLLRHLGFDASITGENEDGEEVWEL